MTSKTLNIILAIIISVLLLGGIYYLVSYGPNINSGLANPPGNSVDSTSIPAADWETYQFSSASHDFDIRYPQGYTVLEGSKDKDAIMASGYIPACDPDASIVCVIYPKNNFVNYNFQGGAVSVNVIPDAEDQNSCTDLESAYSNGSNTKTLKTINGVNFAYIETGDAAAGHQAADHIYRVFRGTTCFEINERVNTTTYENYPEGSINKFTDADRAKVFSGLDAIAQTFKFN